MATLFGYITESTKPDAKPALIIGIYTAFCPVKGKRRAVINGNMRYECLKNGKENI